MEAAHPENPPAQQSRDPESGVAPGSRVRAVALAVAALLIGTAFVIGRRLWFFSDDWNIYADYHSGNLLEPFNGHLSLLPAGLYQATFQVLGVGSYLPYRLLGLLALGVLGFQVLRYAGTRAGGWAAALAVAAVLWNSAGTTNVMFPFLMNFSLPIAALLAMWWHLDAIQAPEGLRSRASRRGEQLESGVFRRRSRRNEEVCPEEGSPPAQVLSAAEENGPPVRPTTHLVALGLWAALALATSGLGVVAVGAVGFEMLLRRSPWRTWVALGIPVLAWLVWWLGHRSANEVSTDPGEVVPYFLRMLWAGTTSLAAGWAPGGLLLAGLFVAAIAASIARRRRIDPRVASALAAAVAFAGLTALTRQDTTPPIPPDELRYGWTIGAYLVFVAIALWPDIRDPEETAARAPTGQAKPAGDATRPAPSPAVARVLLVMASAVLALGALRLTDGILGWTDTVADAAPGLRSNIYAAEAAGADRLDPEEVIRPLSFVPVTAGAYLDAVADVGSPLEGATGADIGGRADQRLAADELFFSAVELELTIGPVRAAERECSDALEAPPGTTVIVQAVVARGAGALEQPVARVSRFGDEPIVELALSGPVVAHTLELPADAPVGTDAVVPYRLSGSAGVTLCVDATQQGP